MAQIKVNHYKSLRPGAGEKTLVTEVVTTDSETGRFLEKMERKRLLRPCFETIDMRGKVPGECRRYLLNNRVFYLDDVSYGIYQKGVNEQNGVFTVGTYEAIVNGSHTNKAMREAERKRELAEQRAVEVRKCASGSGGGGGAAGEDRQDDPRERRFNPDTVPFGYFKKRREERLQYVTPVTLRLGAQELSASSRDISISGLQLTVKGRMPFPLGRELLVTFPALAEQNPKPRLHDLAYEIVGCDTRGTDTLLRLRMRESDRPAGFSEFVVDLIQRFRRKYKLDVEDDFISIQAWLYERIYTESMLSIPFFLRREDDGLRVDAVAVTDGNQPFAHFFHSSVDSHDFSAICLPERVARYEQGEEVVIAMCRQKEGGEYRIQSLADFEAPDAEAFGRFVRYALSHREHCVVKVQPCALPFREPSMKKFEMASERLWEKSPAEAERLREALERISFACVMVNITEQAEAIWFAAEARGVENHDVTGIECWCGHERRRLPGMEGCGSADAGRLRPRLIRFGYVERRREDRYLAETAVELTAGRSRIKGRTRDISTRGLAVMVDGDPGIQVGDELKVALISLQKKRPSLNLQAVPYRVVATQPGQQTAIMLERMRNRDEYKIDDFFVELISKNKDKLAVDLQDTLSAAISRAYEGLIARNIVGLPFFIARGEAGGGVLQQVAVPDEPVPLAEFFRMPDGGYDFSFLTDPRLVLALYQQIGSMARDAQTEHRRPSPVEMEVYCYRERDEATGVEILHAATELEFNSEEERDAFIDRALAAERHCFVKLTATYSLEMNKLELDKAVDFIRGQSRHRAARLQEAVLSVMGLGELVDITAQVALARERRRVAVTEPGAEAGVS